MLLAASLGSRAGGAEDPSYSVQNADVRVSVPLRPGGAFEAKTQSLWGRLRASGARPVLLGGELSADLATIDTGIELRNRHLRETYLEVAKGAGFDKAVLSQIKVAAADGQAFRGKSAFTALLLLHGVKQQVAGSCEIRSESSGVRVEASFPLALRDFGIEPPQYMGVGVGNRLLVKVAFSAVPSAGAE